MTASAENGGVPLKPALEGKLNTCQAGIVIKLERQLLQARASIRSDAECFMLPNAHEQKKLQSGHAWAACQGG